MRIISVDFGGTYTKLGLVENGVLLTTGTIDSQSDGRLTHSLQRVVEKIKELFSYVQWQWGEADGAMFALPCFISQDFLSVTKTFGKFNDAPDIDFRAWAKRELRVPLLLENDARAAILGEWSMGAGQGSQNVVMVTLGTGIGTAVISSGQLFRGAHGLGCALGGHTVTHLSGEKCSCGIQGCMEHHVSSWSLPERAKAHPLWQESELSKASHIDYRTVFEMAEQGDALATILRTKALDGWGALVINLIHFFDPEKVIMGGGIMASTDIILSSVRKKIDSQISYPLENIHLCKASLGNNAALIGGYALFKSIHDNPTLTA